MIVIGAVKYSVLKVSPTQNIVFDIDKSVSLDGDSGPYIQYTYARTQSIVSKAQSDDLTPLTQNESESFDWEERELLRLLSRFQECVIDSAERLSPNLLCSYLFELSQAFNLFYQKYPILKADSNQRKKRLLLVSKTGIVLKTGLSLLGIKTPQRI